jgi:hypothetical protein
MVYSGDDAPQGLPLALGEESKEGATLSAAVPPASAADAVAYVVGAPPGTCGAAATPDFAAAAEHLATALAAAAAAAPPPPAPRGRVGPAEVEMADVRGAAVAGPGGALLSRAAFSTARATAGAVAGRWAYEAQLRTGGIMQLGWAPLRARFTGEEGVGDFPDSFSYDGRRQRRWNAAAAPYGDRWAAGDIITCGIDMEAGTISYWRNGAPLGVAFSSPAIRAPPTGALFPCVSLSIGEACEVNFGGRPLRHAPAGYAPLAAPAAGAPRAAALAACLGRLAEVAAAAAEAAGAAPAGAPAPLATAPPALPTGDGVLLASVLAAPLGPLLRCEYCLEAALLPALRALRPAALTALLRLLAPALEPTERAALAAGAAAAAGREARAAAWAPAEFPDSAAARALRFVAAFLAAPPLAAAWLDDVGGWPAQLEDLFAVRQPPPADLAAAVPHLAWDDGGASGASGGASSGGIERVLAGRSEGGDYAGDTNALAAALAALEDAQVAVLAALWRHGRAAVGTAGRAEDPAVAAAAAAEAGADQVAVFLEWLVVKNRQALRRVPLPGLSDPTALVSAFFAAARLLSPQLDAAHVRGAAAAWHPALFAAGAPLPPRPAGALPAANSFFFGGASSALSANRDAFEDGVRLGGLLSSVGAEHPLARRPLDAPTLEASPPAIAPPAAPRPGGWAAPPPPPPPDVAADALVAHNGWSWRVWDRLLCLWHLGVANRVRAGFAAVHQLENALSTLRAVDGQLAAAGGGAGGGAPLLRASAAECQRAALEALRAHAWHAAWLQPPWKQDATLALASVVARLLLSLAADTDGDLLRYVPELYLEASLDMMHAARRAEHRPRGGAAALAAWGAEDVVAATVALLPDRRVVAPEARSMLLQTAWALLQEGEGAAIVASSPAARAGLLPALLAVLSDERSWLQAANALALLLDGVGLLARPAGGGGGGAGAAEPGEEAEAARKEVRSWLAEYAARDPEAAAASLSGLFERANWAVTELASAAGELDAAAAGVARGGAGAAQRRAVAVADLASTLLRLAELAAARAPALFLGDGRAAAAARTRLAEATGFALRQLAGGGALGEAIRRRGVGSAAAGGGAGGGQDRRLRAAVADDLLAAAAGALVALWAAAAADAPARARLAAALAAQGLPGARLRAVADELPLFSPDAFDAVQAPLEALAAAVDAAAGGDAFGGAGAASATDATSADASGPDGEGDDEPPDDLLDPIMHTLMEDPVLLPHSGVVLDRATIERHLAGAGTDPFSRAPLAKEALLPAADVAARVAAWRAERPGRRRGKRV